MCTDLKIKIAIIRRCWTRSTTDVFASDMASGMLGCNVSEEIVSYVLRNNDRAILRGIQHKVKLAIELDNLRCNWH
jgi:hypothetical protein